MRGLEETPGRTLSFGLLQFGHTHSQYYHPNLTYLPGSSLPATLPLDPYQGMGEASIFTKTDVT